MTWSAKSRLASTCCVNQADFCDWHYLSLADCRFFWHFLGSSELALLWGPRSDTSVAHLTRDGVIGLVLGLAGVAVALSPRLAYFALSICGLLVSLQAIAFVTDRMNSKVQPVFETVHVLALIISAAGHHCGVPPTYSAVGLSPVFV